MTDSGDLVLAMPFMETSQCANPLSASVFQFNVSLNLVQLKFLGR